MTQMPSLKCILDIFTESMDNREAEINKQQQQTERSCVSAATRGGGQRWWAVSVLQRLNFFCLLVLFPSRLHFSQTHSQNSCLLETAQIISMFLHDSLFHVAMYLSAVARVFPLLFWVEYMCGSMDGFKGRLLPLADMSLPVHRFGSRWGESHNRQESLGLILLQLSTST